MPNSSIEPGEAQHHFFATYARLLCSSITSLLPSRDYFAQALLLCSLCKTTLFKHHFFASIVGIAIDSNITTWVAPSATLEVATSSCLESCKVHAVTTPAMIGIATQSTLTATISTTDIAAIGPDETTSSNVTKALIGRDLPLATRRDTLAIVPIPARLQQHKQLQLLQGNDTLASTVNITQVFGKPQSFVRRYQGGDHLSKHGHHPFTSCVLERVPDVMACPTSWHLKTTLRGEDSMSTTILLVWYPPAYLLSSMQHRLYYIASRHQDNNRCSCQCLVTSTSINYVPTLDPPWILISPPWDSPWISSAVSPDTPWSEREIIKEAVNNIPRYSSLPTSNHPTQSSVSSRGRLRTFQLRTFRQDIDKQVDVYHCLLLFTNQLSRQQPPLSCNNLRLSSDPILYSLWTNVLKFAHLGMRETTAMKAALTAQKPAGSECYFLFQSLHLDYF